MPRNRPRQPPAAFMLGCRPMSRPSVLVRFGVQADDGRHSSVWNVWTNESTYQGRRGDDIYLAVRQTAARAKVSLHSSGPVSYTHLRAHETRHDLVCRLLL